jgi:hypothetical protein
MPGASRSRYDLPRLNLFATGDDQGEAARFGQVNPERGRDTTILRRTTMTTSTNIAFALAILMGFAAVPAKALEPGECTPWKPLLGGACKMRKCVVGTPPAARLVPETVCPHEGIPTRPIIDRGLFVPGSKGSTAPQ